MSTGKPAESEATTCSQTQSRTALSTNYSTDEDLLWNRSFSVSGPAVWNSLPAALRCDDVTLLTFRTRLKAALFNT